jgi:hypothetical protein
MGLIHEKTRGKKSHANYPLDHKKNCVRQLKVEHRLACRILNPYCRSHRMKASL